METESHLNGWLCPCGAVQALPPVEVVARNQEVGSTTACMCCWLRVSVWSREGKV